MSHDDQRLSARDFVTIVMHLDRRNGSSRRGMLVTRSRPATYQRDRIVQSLGTDAKLPLIRVDPMAQLNITMKHDQSPDEARVNFVEAITAAHQEHGHWIKTVEWSDDRTSAILSGPGYKVTLSFDDENVYARGTIPLALKLMERPIRRFVVELLERYRRKPA